MGYIWGNKQIGNHIMERYKLRIHILILFISGFIISSGIILFFINIAIKRPEDYTDLAFIIALILLLIIGGPPVILTITYFLEDFRKYVTIDFKNGILWIENRNEKIEFNKEDLLEVYHVKVDKYSTSRLKYPMYEYLLFVFKERKKLIITNLICKPEKLKNALGIKSKMIYKNFPFIDREMGNAFLTTDEFERKVKEFYENLQDKPDNELVTICKQQGYANYAKKAARQILDDRIK